ncbi:hypothetical protein AAGG42_22770, partial [Stenotrophomonas maltophilia]
MFKKLVEAVGVEEFKQWLAQRNPPPPAELPTITAHNARAPNNRTPVPVAIPLGHLDPTYIHTPRH